MNILRSVKGFELNEGTGMANGLFNISHTENPNYLSNWFDKNSKDEFLQYSDNEFVTICETLTDTEIK